MNLGKRIKTLRLQKSVTQETLAEHLYVSAQAVSKWENGITTPDIQLLPELSVYFGVSIDELFNMTDKKHLERIDSMLSTKKVLSNEEFKYAEETLKNNLSNTELRGESSYLLSELYNLKAKNFMEMAEFYAMEALKEHPTWKCIHASLTVAQNGTHADWNYKNHHKRISYYLNFVKKNPNYARGYLYLLEELIADGRLDEAEARLTEMKKAKDDLRVDYYKGKIVWARGNHKEAYSIWNNMIDRYADHWLAYSYLADRLASDCQYDQAIENYKKAFNLQPSPKYTDSQESIAHIYEISGDYEKAIEAWNVLINILESEWSIKEGQIVDEALNEIERISRLLV